MANYLRRSRVYKNRRQSARHSIKQHFFKQGGNPPKVAVNPYSNPSAPAGSLVMVSETPDKKKDGSELGIQVDIDSNGNEGEAIVDSEDDWIDEKPPLDHSDAKPGLKHHIRRRLTRARAAKAALTSYYDAEQRLAEQMGLSVAEMIIKDEIAAEERIKKESFARHAAEVKIHGEEMLNRKPLTADDMRGYGSYGFALSRD